MTKYLFILGALLLLYAIAIPILLKNKIIKEVDIKLVRRIYYSIWILGSAYIIHTMDKVKIKEWGINKLGFNETIWFFIMVLIAGFIVDCLVVTAIEIKEINLPGGASLKGSEEVRQQLNEQKDLAVTLENKVEAFFKCSVDLFTTSVGPAKERLNKGEEIELPDEFEKILKKYASLQEDWQLDVEVIEPTDMSAKKSNYGLTGEELKEFEKHMEAGHAYLFKQKEINFLIVPFNSSLVEGKYYIIMSTKNDLYSVERVMVLMLLQQFEVQFLGE